MQNGYIESFNGKFRDECLNEHWFETLPQARAVIAAWRQDYNEVRPHSSCHGCRRPSSPRCIGSMLPMQRNPPPKNPLTLQPDFLPINWYGYRGQVIRGCSPDH
jgi:putative transposase